MVNKIALADDLKILFMDYQNRLGKQYVGYTPTNESELIDRYQKDTLFHAQVDSLTYAVMKVLDSHI